MSTTGQEGGNGMAAGQQVASAAAEQVGQVSQQAAAQTKQVAGVAVDQARTVIDQTKDHMHQQAEGQTQQAAAALSRLGDQARALLSGNHQDAGSLPEYAENVVSRVEELAGRMQQRGFDGIMGDLQRYARRRPGIFLLGATAVGFGVGRLLRSGAAQQATSSDQPPTTPGTLPPGPAITPMAPAMDIEGGAPPVGSVPPPPAEAAVGPDWAGR